MEMQDSFVGILVS